MTELKTKINPTELNTKIGLEIHVQLKTKSKMFCGCDNNAEGKAPNSVVCPVCLGLPGALPVANKQAIEWTIKTGLALNCEIPKIAKFDRKHYFYPDLPKGYQISQYDEPFCLGGYIEVGGQKANLTRIHLEEDAGKLIHLHGKSLVDLNRAGTPLMEIVTEPDITSPKMAGDFLRKLQKIVRDVVEVSEASMEKGHMRCDANISVNDGDKMSPIVEIKNINSFRFVEKALTLVREKLRDEYEKWPEKKIKETWGYDSVGNKVFLQRSKEEAADYRYFPEPDLSPIKTEVFDLRKLEAEIKEDEDAIILRLMEDIPENFAKIITNNKRKAELYEKITPLLDKECFFVAARIIANNEFGFEFGEEDLMRLPRYAELIKRVKDHGIHKTLFQEIASKIHEENISSEEIEQLSAGGTEENLQLIISKVLENYPKEVVRYKNGENQLLGFFVGQVMKETGGKANPQNINKILREKL